MLVNKNVGGSHLVVFANHGRHYLDARKDVRHPNHSFIEIVKDGFVKHKQVVHNDKAPQEIVKLMKEYLQ